MTNIKINTIKHLQGAYRTALTMSGGNGLHESIEAYKLYARSNPKELVETTQLMTWVDLETTGLNPNKDKVLEIAVAITNTDYVLIDYVDYVRKYEDGITKDILPVVRDMHTVNGLFAAMGYGASHDILSMDSLSAHFIKKYRTPNGSYWEKQPICGTSPHYDLSFLETELPDTRKLFTHRTFDTSNFLHAINLLGKGDKVLDVPPPKVGKPHRALYDILVSIQNMARHIDILNASIPYRYLSTDEQKLGYFGTLAVISQMNEK